MSLENIKDKGLIVMNRMNIAEITIRERIAVNYLFFRFPSSVIIIIIPYLFAAITFFLTPSQSAVGENDANSILDTLQVGTLSNYLLAIKLALVVIFSYFISFRWSYIQNRGILAYWLTLGTDRRKMFLWAFQSFVLYGFTGVFLSIIVIIYPGGFSIAIVDIFLLLLSLFTNTLLMVSVAIFFGEVISVPSLAFLAMNVFYLTNIFLVNNVDSLFFALFQGELAYFSQGFLTSFFIPIPLATLLLLLSYNSHKKRNINF